MAEFKKLSEVDVLETASDNATVLIEEGGDIKRVPKKEVGGAGGYYLTLSESNCECYWDTYQILCSENYDELYDVLMAGGSAWIDMALIAGEQPAKPYAMASMLPMPTNYAGMVIPLQWWNITDVGLFASTTMWGDYWEMCFPNGSHNLEPRINEEN